MKKKPWGDVILSENTDLVLLPEDLDKNLFKEFINHDELVLEIGSGKGDFVITMAKKYPHIHFVAIEMQSMALSKTMTRATILTTHGQAEQEKTSNIILISVPRLKLKSL